MKRISFTRNDSRLHISPNSSNYLSLTFNLVFAHTRRFSKIQHRSPNSKNLKKFLPNEEVYIKIIFSLFDGKGNKGL